MPAEFPKGRYLSATGVARLNSGGQTRALLMRSRLISAATGTRVDVLCFDPSRSYDRVRSEWRQNGLLSDGVRLLNLYEHYRQFGWGEEGSTGEELPPLPDLEAVEKPHPDGSPWQTSYRDPLTGLVVMNDYRRADNSVYLRAAPYRTVSTATLPRELIRVSPTGEILGSFTTLTEWYHRWIRELTVADERTFLFMDSRYLVPLIAPIQDPAVHLIYVLHNCHVPAPRRWNTPPTQDYRRCLERIGDVDAFVTLTDRQRTDIELRWGHRTNLEVVPNPVEIPPSPATEKPRDPHGVISIARLERQKRVQDAIRVMELVVKDIPDAHLDVYGAGRKHEPLQALIHDLGLDARVTLHGHDPRARDRLWTASAFLLTSEFEGYPLVTLESLSRGCPVVSYDVPYGPREQLSEGVSGFLVTAGEVGAAAARVVQLLSAPGLVTTMSAAGRQAARHHGTDAFVADWARVLQSVVDRSSRRISFDSVDSSVEIERVSDPSGWLRNKSRQWVVSGLVHVSAGSVGVDPGQAVLTLDVVDEPTGMTVSVPVETVRDRLDFRFRAVVDLVEVFATLPQGSEPTMRLRLTWENAGWETPVRSAHPLPRASWGTVTSDGVVRLRSPGERRRPSPVATLWRSVVRSRLPGGSAWPGRSRPR